MSTPLEPYPGGGPDSPAEPPIVGEYSYRPNWANESIQPVGDWSGDLPGEFAVTPEATGLLLNALAAVKNRFDELKGFPSDTPEILASFFGPYETIKGQVRRYDKEQAAIYSGHKDASVRSHVRIHVWTMFSVCDLLARLEEPENATHNLAVFLDEMGKAHAPVEVPAMPPSFEEAGRFRNFIDKSYFKRLDAHNQAVEEHNQAVPVYYEREHRVAYGLLALDLVNHVTEVYQPYLNAPNVSPRKTSAQESPTEPVPVDVAASPPAEGPLPAQETPVEVARAAQLSPEAVLGWVDMLQFIDTFPEVAQENPVAVALDITKQDDDAAILQRVSTAGAVNRELKEALWGSLAGLDAARASGDSDSVYQHLDTITNLMLRRLILMPLVNRSLNGGQAIKRQVEVKCQEWQAMDKAEIVNIESQDVNFDAPASVLAAAASELRASIAGKSEYKTSF